jgi:predicted permease
MLRGHDHPYVGLLYLAAPISLLILIPNGFLLLETGQPSSNKITRKWRRVAQVWIKLFLNPIISMTILGVLANPTFQSISPIMISKFLDALGAAFTPMAPFTLGLGIVGKIGNIRGDTLIPIVYLLFSLH